MLSHLIARLTIHQQVIYRSLLGLLGCLLSIHGANGQRPEDRPKSEPLPPSEAVAAFTTLNDSFLWESAVTEPAVRQPVMATFDLSGRLWVVQYLQYPEPAGLKIVSRDNFWRAIYDRKPPPPLGPLQGKDKLTVFDLDRSPQSPGHDFVSGLNIATAVAPDVDGVWVLNPPYLLYYKDENHDLIPDAPPEIHLDGFGLEDTHSVVNSLCFGPDGWLYAAQGSTVTGAVKRYGSDDPPVRSMGQLVWRYHPSHRIYEVFAEGGGNAFGVAFDDAGRIFSGHNGGDTRGFHYEQGGYYRKGFNKHGELSNPFAYGYLMPMKHDPIPRFTHSMVLTQGTQFEEAFPNAMFAIDPLHGTVIATELAPKGATYQTNDVAIAVQSSDKWFRPVAIVEAPDGSVYVCDWYDRQVAHTYAHAGELDRDHGRVYRLAVGGTPSPSATPWDSSLVSKTDDESLTALLEKLHHPYRWQRWGARRLIARHPKRATVKEKLVELSLQNSPFALDAFWTLHACGWLEDTMLSPPTENGPSTSIHPYLVHPNADVRRWGLRLMCDDKKIEPSNLASVAERAEREDELQVLVQLAGSLRRLPSEQALPIAQKLVQRLEEKNDPTVTLMTWWLIERFAMEPEQLQRSLVAPLDPWKDATFSQEIAPRLLRRWLEMRSPAGMHQAATLLKRIDQLPEEWKSIAAPAAVGAFETAFAGRSLAGVTDDLLESLEKLGSPPLSLRLRRGDADAVAEAIRKMRDNAVSRDQRIQWIRILGEVPAPSSAPELLSLALETKLPTPLREAIIQTLSRYPEIDIATSLLNAWSEMPQELRIATAGSLSLRLPGAKKLLAAIEDEKIRPGEIPLEIVRAMRQHNDAELQQALNRHFPNTLSMDLSAATARVQKILTQLDQAHGDPYKGRTLYAERCGRCHRLFEKGGEIGPDLTGYQRDAVEVLALNIVAPSLEVREGYQSVAIRTEDGDVLVGFLESELADEIVLKGVDGKVHVVPRDSIEALRPQAESLMPQGLLDDFSEEQIRDLFAYLRSPQPISD